MLYFVLRNDKSISWHIGEAKPNFETEDIVEIQADCDELNYIFNNFRGIPFAFNKRVVNWFGDVAKFIAHNL